MDYNAIQDVIAENLGVDKAKVTPDAHLGDDLGADSLDLTELLMAFEEKFDMAIPDSDASELYTPQRIMDYINTYKKE